MSDVATIIAELIAAGTPKELVGRVAAALSAREVVVMRDEQAERRRERDRQRKQSVRGIPQTSADSADTPSIESLDKEKHIEGQSADVRRIPQTQKKAHQLPADWTLPAPWREWAVAEGCADPDREAAKFADHFRGSGTRKQDWQATWRNWVRKAADFAPRKPNAPAATGSAAIVLSAPDRNAELKTRAAFLKTASKTLAHDAANRYPRQDIETMLRLELLTVADLQRIGVTFAPRAVG
jgi:hypothetical protein